MRDLLFCMRSMFLFRGYRPQPVSFFTIRKWITQFEKADRRQIAQLLRSIIFINEAKVRKSLVEQNQILMAHLDAIGFPANKLIYVAIDDAGSSSHVMLNMLRDSARLEQQGCEFVDSKDALKLRKLTNRMEEGAIIYVDDFVGSGLQISESRAFVRDHVVGSFSEFLLVASICEEGYDRMEQLGVNAYTGHLHTKAERPLHPESDLLERSIRLRLTQICDQIDGRMGIGFDQGAVMVVLYRNAPDNVPVIFRGNVSQQPFVGVFPRYSDLPV